MPPKNDNFKFPVPVIRDVSGSKRPYRRRRITRTSFEVNGERVVATFTKDGVEFRVRYAREVKVVSVVDVYTALVVNQGLLFQMPGSKGKAAAPAKPGPATAVATDSSAQTAQPLAETEGSARG